jgi:hypothetical protein
MPQRTVGEMEPVPGRNPDGSYFPPSFCLVNCEKGVGAAYLLPFPSRGARLLRELPWIDGSDVIKARLGTRGKPSL